METVTTENVVMLRCPRCQERVQSNAKLCPFCGHRFGASGKARRVGRILAYLLVTLLVVFIVYGCYFSGGSF
jgi:tRNA(Ile2) C34 agmatinyltransferase TiaS